jgi:MFS family permease
MQTGTSLLNLDKKYSLTLILLCIGYFIDFYDLTIFSAGYTNIIRDLFSVTDTEQIQLLYLKITNFYTAGIIIGSIIFGILGDKFGRITVVRYSILLYSLSIIASTFTHSLSLFIFLRFLAGAGLASEFGTSSVLISELLPTQYVSRYTSALYCCGILGGITATFLGAISWQFMFSCGGIAGLILYLARKNLFESQLFLTLQPQVKRGNIWQLVSTWPDLIKTLRLFILITPFYFLISVMFIYPSFMPVTSDLTHLTTLLLIGFFSGNLISTLGCNYILTKFKDYRVYIAINSLAFCLIMSIFGIVTQPYFFYYALLLGLLGGGLPTVWIQLVTKSYGTNQRNTASNTLYALGRSSSIGFNFLISSWLGAPQSFSAYCLTTIITLTLVVLIALWYTANTYSTDSNYLEGRA